MSREHTHFCDLGGVQTAGGKNGGGTVGRWKKWGGSVSGGRRPQERYTPPLLVFMAPSLKTKKKWPKISTSGVYLSKKIFREPASKLFMCTWGVIGICQNDFWIISQCGWRGNAPFSPVPTYVVNFQNEGIK